MVTGEMGKRENALKGEVRIQICKQCMCMTGREDDSILHDCHGLLRGIHLNT